MPYALRFRPNARAVMAGLPMSLASFNEGSEGLLVVAVNTRKSCIFVIFTIFVETPDAAEELDAGGTLISITVRP
jgi:hypothetical protein